MDDYLTKPVNRDQLILVLQRILTLSGNRRNQSTVSQSLEPRDLPCIDFPSLINRFNGDEPRVLRLLQQAIEYFKHDLLEIGRCMEEQEWQGMAQSLHRLKGASANMATIALYQQCLVLENILATGDTNALPRGYQAMENELDRVIVHIALLAEQIPSTAKLEHDEENISPSPTLLHLLEQLKEDLIAHNLIESSRIDALERELENSQHQEKLGLLIQQLRGFDYTAAFKQVEVLLASHQEATKHD
jgi:HPt (histidine-containing phosphotransfer) domain-containing protein